MIIIFIASASYLTLYLLSIIKISLILLENQVVKTHEVILSKLLSILYHYIDSIFKRVSNYRRLEGLDYQYIYMWVEII